MEIVWGVLAFLAGAGLTALVLRGSARSARAVLEERLRAREGELASLVRSAEAALAEATCAREERSRAVAEVARLSATLEAERSAHTERLRLLAAAEQRLSDSFRALSVEALSQSQSSFLELARATFEKYQVGAQGDLDARRQAIDELVRPLQESLTKVDLRIQELETTRAAAYSGLTEQLKALASGQSSLERETGRLVSALRAPAARGRWGEIQLQRVVEMAGMVAYCDFTPQPSVATGDGRLRPDLLVRLPGGKNVVIDAKAPLEAFLEALEAQGEDERRQKLVAHARQVRNHLLKLGEKGYWSQFSPSPEFVVLFLPGETFFSAALEHDPGLIELGVDRQVIVATPTTLIALLRAVAYGWRQAQVEENARAISELGRVLHDRLRAFVGHLAAVKRGLDSSVDAYNRAVGSLESRILPQARRFQDLGAAVGEEIEVLEGIDRGTRGVGDG